MYLQRLVEQLTEGLARLPAERRARHVAYLRAAQAADGGYSGREGGSDLYYTAFGLRGLAVLGALDQEVCAKAAPFLRHSLTQQTSVVDFFSLLYACLLVQVGGGPDVLADSPADWPDRVAGMLETFRTTDGGYAKAAGSASGSTYHTFLVALCYQLLGRPVPRPEAVRAFIHARRREDGGFVEIAPMKRSGTNPTAAAVGVLQLLDSLSEDLAAAVAGFLAQMPNEEGGCRANARAPLADLLSTFTGLWTLAQVGVLDRVDLTAARTYVDALEMQSGGFRGGLWDDRSDVEYTFYGLGTLALME